jgi:glycosyltransferase involved in cell wall biosynthesis
MTGGYVYDRKLAEHLREKGDDVEVFSIPWRSYPRHLMDNLSSHLADRLARARLDILLQDELNHPSLFLLNRRLRPRVSYPIISVVHHLRSCEEWSLPVRIFYRIIEQQYLGTIRAFVFNSHATRCSVRDLLGRPECGVIAHPGGNRLDVPLGQKEIVARVARRGPLRLAFVGNLIPRKGLHGLLTTLASMKNESWELSVAGSSEIDLKYTARIHRIITESGLEKRVRLLGALTDGALVHLLKQSDLIAMPFSYEGFGIAYLEGMAYGLPALASRTGGAEEIVAHGKSGYLLEPGDVNTLAAILRRLIEDRHELKRLSLAARGRFGEFPTWEETTARIRNFLLGVVHSAGRDS